MVDILEFIDELKELKALYQSGDLREFDFNNKILKFERQVSMFENEIEQQNLSFFGAYSPKHEV